MEMSWFALLPTIVAVVILAALVLTRSEEPRSVTDTREQGSEATRASTPFTTLAPWADAAKTLLRDARQPVWPIDKVAFEAQGRRGMIVAGVMAIMALLAILGNDHNEIFGPTFGFILAVIPFTGVAMAFSALHSIILRLLPYRGPIVSTVLGALIGLATMLVAYSSPVPNRKLIYVGAIYGLIVGAIEFVMPPEKTRHPRSGRSSAKERTRL
jgi:MFS family permease